MGRPSCARCGFSPRRRAIHLIQVASGLTGVRWLCRYTDDCASRRRA